MASVAGRRRPKRDGRRRDWRTLMDVLTLGLWSLALFRYWITGKLFLLLHPNYMWLANGAAILLMGMALFKLRQWWRPQSRPGADHATLLPSYISSIILTATAVVSLIYTPQAFTSDTAIQRGIADSLTLTRSQPQRFVRQASPEERTIIDWIRTLNVYPEPDAYATDPVDVSGFVIHPQDWPDDYLMVSRFVLTCCAADAYPVGLPVRLEASRQSYPPDTWLSVQGRMTTDTIAGQRQLAIQPTQIEPIPEPRNPYQY